MKNFNFDRELFFRVMKVGAPLGVQLMLMNMLGLVDNIMVGQLGASEIAAVGLANQVRFLVILFLFGLNSGINIFTSQYWGKKDSKNIHKLIGISLISGSILTLFVGFSAVTQPQLIMSFLTPDTTVVESGVLYLSIIGFSYFFTSVTMAYAFACRATGSVMLPTVINIINVCLNTVLNYLLIFGNFGFPEMGVAGAALATLIANLTCTTSLVVIIFLKKLTPAGPLKEYLNFDFPYLQRIYKVVSFSILATIAWGIGMTMYNMIFARISTEAVAAFTIVSMTGFMAFSLIDGLSNGASIVLGNTIGAGEYEKVYSYSKEIMLIVIGTALIIDLFLALFTPILVTFYKIDPETSILVKRMIWTFCLYFPIKAATSSLLNGMLKSGGDTRFMLIIDPGAMYVFGVLTAFVTGIVLQFPPDLVFLICNVEEIAKLLISVFRFRSKKWINQLAV